ncbi:MULTISPECIES: PilN domain-containing protein [Legionella]|uniref:Pilus assembly protein PilN n=1 Tax=Legionella septentrionalis TaxID=2498109 RepID=A0A433JKK4_9GAMM|nr:MULTISPECIES: PilN domain-containing protein [Legionella]MCP0914486.1 PilN domain-containing protein [Legionella sp. 27cVA30]RUQ89452.1 pilus assembly protein PilN [Legionella septentrionalis]RUQ95592.1 pilus assembly protein PilN [Legionella septentrionalis]RUR10465.1 pilus assembly protein PilN [Legionella septentrionalis]RUR16085.1 pilus assembly protein PilN [Legionella septentrionalis]
MADINLLPWRELKREREKKEFGIFVFIGLTSAVLIIFLINFYAKQLVEQQSRRNEILQTEITRLEKQIKEIADIKKLRQALIARMRIVQNLQGTRSLTVRLFDELIKIMPDGVFLTHVERSGDKVTLLGYAESNTNISQLMRNIENNQWIQNPELTEIKKTKEETPSSNVENEFKLSFILRPATNL